MKRRGQDLLVKRSATEGHTLEAPTLHSWPVRSRKAAVSSILYESRAQGTRNDQGRILCNRHHSHNTLSPQKRDLAHSCSQPPISPNEHLLFVPPHLLELVQTGSPERPVRRGWWRGEREGGRRERGGRGWGERRGRRWEGGGIGARRSGREGMRARSKVRMMRARSGLGIRARSREGRWSEGGV